MNFNFPIRLPIIFCVIVSSLFIGGSQEVRAQPQSKSEIIRVMSFNLWHGGDAGKQPLDQTVAVIKACNADVVGMQETEGVAPNDKPRPDNAAKLAEKLGWHYLNQGGRTGIISRYKIVESTPKKWGAKLELPNGNHIFVFNAHLAHSPYQPYQLLSIPYGDGAFFKTAAEAVKAANEARGKQVEEMLSEIKSVSPTDTIFVTGDFNEPSHHDWTEAVFKAKLCPVAVEWPSTKAVVEAGFIDAFRSVRPDPVSDRGLTWTPTTKLSDPQDRHDRIDFVFARGKQIKVKSASVIGEDKKFADIVVTPYPSDHRAVLAEVELVK